MRRHRTSRSLSTGVTHAAAVILCVCAATFLGCGYTSAYRAPRDGRARLVWRTNSVQIDLGGRHPSNACVTLLANVTGRSRSEALNAFDTRGGRFEPMWNRATTRAEPDNVKSRQFIPERPQQWLPRYASEAPLTGSESIDPDRPPLFAPTLVWSRPPRPDAATASKWDEWTFADLSQEEGVVDLVSPIPFAILGMFLPPFGWALALKPPFLPVGPWDKLTFVNLYNDLARVPGSPCAFESAKGIIP